MCDKTAPSPNGEAQDDAEVTRVARLLGKRGGDQTKKRGPEYYAKIGKLGLEKRWKKKAKPLGEEQPD